MKQYKDLILDALDQYKGDDLARAELAFKGMSEEEMNLPHGQSGRTRKEILDEYKEHNAKVNAAIKWVVQLPD